MKKTKKISLIILIIILILVFTSIVSSQAISGLVEVIDASLIGKKLASGSIYNPDENSCITSKYTMLTVLLLENIINGKKTIVYVIDTNPNFKFNDSIMAISSRAAKELGENNNVQIAVKVTVLKEGTSVQPGNQNQQQNQQQTQTTTTSSTNINQTNQTSETQQTAISSLTSPIPIYTNAKQTNTTYYYIQVGAFKSKDNAIILAQKLKNLGYKVFIYYNQLYKVIVGPYTKQEEAIELKKLLSNILPNDQPFIFSANIIFE